MARQADLIAQHLEIVDRHCRERDVPRGCAHAFAAYGHLPTLSKILDQQAIAHASKSSITA